MAYGYMRLDPVEQCKNALGYYDKLIAVAMEKGYTKDQAIELLKVYGLFGIESNTYRQKRQKSKKAEARQVKVSAMQ